MPEWHSTFQWKINGTISRVTREQEMGITLRGLRSPQPPTGKRDLLSGKTRWNFDFYQQMHFLIFWMAGIWYYFYKRCLKGLRTCRDVFIE